ncbi:MAG: hypothetical protein HC895_21790 [Leptolyngbyaceae cyanobacterium SM1_3_5]|nr:hypothetical protein [Leptolyngbyaceae cyanobacterium SM1_3_5]
MPLPALAEVQPIRPSIDCPADLPTLTILLLRDLPSYANRVTQRSFTGLDVAASRPGYVLVAGRPEFEPLSLGPGEYLPTIETAPQQIFFTTLERQYVNNRSIYLQHYHWVFLSQESDGWWLVTMRSQIGDLPADQPPTPPQDTSDGAIAQAIRLWLRDCRNRAITPPA